MNNMNPVVWFEIYVENMGQAQKFYETVFDTTLENLPTPPGNEELQMLTFSNTSSKKLGASGALVKMEGMKVGGNSTIVYFGSEDCSVEEARVEAAGGTVVKSKASIGEFGFMVLATDTEGNMIGIHSMK